MDYGFSNRHETRLYYGRVINKDISFSVAINKETLEIERIDVIDDDFGQPYDYQSILLQDSTHLYSRGVYDKVDTILTTLQGDGIIKGYVRGMYV